MLASSTSMESICRTFTGPFIFSGGRSSRIHNPRKKHHITCCSIQRLDVNVKGHIVPKKDVENTDIIEAPLPTSDSRSTDPNDIMKLFNDAQQNILFLNKQRLLAMEELKKVQREKELLLAKLGKVEAEAQSSLAEREILKHKLNLRESKMPSGGSWKFQNDKIHGNAKPDPSPIFSEILLRLDCMVLAGAINPYQAAEIRKLIIKKDFTLVETFNDLRHMNDHDVATFLLSHLESKTRQGLHIIQVATEMTPFTEAGSVALHVTNLGRALQRKNNVVEVILPKYRTMDLTDVQCLHEIQCEFYSYFGGQWHQNKIWTGIIYGMAVTFIETLHPSGFFDREHCYGYDDDFERFTYFCRASLDYLVKSGKQPDILHLHNWQTAAVAPMFWDIFVNKGLEKTRVLFSCHNFELQGVQEPKKIGLCGLVPEHLHRHDRLQDNFDNRFINLLKGGIVYSNKVVAVSSPLVDDQMLGENYHGLESTLSVHKDKVVSIPYALDDTAWDPANDKFLPSTFSAEDLSGKALCKAALRRRVGLFEDKVSIPIVGCVCLDMTTEHFSFIKLALTFAIQNGAQFVLMGTSKNLSVQSGLQEIKHEYKENCRVIDKHDEGLLHLLIAGSDIFACPSPHDPLYQMPLKGIKYGAVPVSTTGKDNMSMIHYKDISTEVLSLSQLVMKMKEDPSQWSKIIQSLMQKDFSWDADCVERYIGAYWSIYQI